MGVAGVVSPSTAWLSFTEGVCLKDEGPSQGDYLSSAPTVEDVCHLALVSRASGIAKSLSVPQAGAQRGGSWAQAVASFRTRTPRGSGREGHFLPLSL